MLRPGHLLCVCALLSSAGCREVFPYPDGLNDAMVRDTEAGDADSGVTDGPQGLRLRVIQQPTEGFVDLPLYPPIIIEVINGGDGPGTEVTLSVQSDQGELVGLTRVEAMDGQAIFEGVSTSLVQPELILVATSGEAWVELDPLHVYDQPPGACLREGPELFTALGGCHDPVAGLTWSGFQAPAKWHEAVWDAAFLDSLPPDPDDLGRTNDYPEGEVSCAEPCDGSGVAVCHSLDEGGFRDWRLPSLAELTALYDHMGDVSYILQDHRIWTSYPAPGSATGQAFELATGLPSPNFKSTAHDILCVRGGRQPISEVRIRSAPFTTGDGTQPPAPMEVWVADADGQQVNAQGLTLSLLSGAGGELQGTVALKTDSRGRATLSQWVLTSSGPLPQQVQLKVIKVDEPDLAPAHHAITVGQFRHTCRQSGNFETQEGGCQYKNNGLVFSAPANIKMTWHMGIWDSTSPAHNIQPDPDDDGAVNDYAPDLVPDSPTKRDLSSLNYCHELVEGGFTDWRMPTADELSLAQAKGSAQEFGFSSEDWYWSANFVLTGANLAIGVWLGQQPQLPASENKITLYKVLCVRQP